jgi:hypothetical protein
VGERKYVASFTLRPFNVIGKLLHWSFFAERDFDTAKNETSEDQRIPGHFPVLAVCMHDR